MSASPHLPQQFSASPNPRDWGRWGARGACAFFALLGALPILLGFAIKSEVANTWATGESQRLLRESLDVSARYRVAVHLWPLRVELSDVSVEATDGGSPALKAQRVAVAPRMFSLLAGRLEIGDVEIEGAEQRLVVRDGKLSNVHYRAPERPASTASARSPFSSLSLTDASFALDIDGIRANISSVDMDVFPDDRGSYEIALRVGESSLNLPQERYPAANANASWDGDVLCQLDARIHLGADGALIRRLSVLAEADIDPAPNTLPDCKKEALDPPGLVALRLNQTRVVAATDQTPWLVQGEVMARLPTELGNRFAPGAGPFRGWVGLNGALRFDGSTKLPEFNGKIKMSELGLAHHVLMQGAEGSVELRQDRIIVSEMLIQYGSGNVVAKDITIAPLEPGMPFLARSSQVNHVPFPEMMSNIGITDDTIVHFTIDLATVADFGGTLNPLKLDGQLNAEVSEFQVFRGSHRSPSRKRMFGLNSKGFTRGIFSIRPDSVQFNDQHVRFGQSSLHTTVHVGFEDRIYLDAWDSKIDLQDISPLVTVPIKGVMHLATKMDGQGSNPTLTSSMSIDGLDFAGFPIGDVERSKLTFRPLWVELQDTVLRKGESRLQIPAARFDFESGADIEIDAQVAATHLRILDFMQMWRFDEDPRWKDVSGHSSTQARVRYVLGGPKDRCGEGDLKVDADLDFDRLALFGETYDGGHAALQLHWLDVEASYHGMDIAVPSFLLKKANGSLLGNFNISPGARVHGNVVASAVPLSSLDAMQGQSSLIQSSLSAVAQISGTLDEMNAEAQVNLGAVTFGRSQLPPSSLHVALKPRPAQLSFAENRKTGCGRAIPLPSEVPSAEAVSGDFHVAGDLFGGQVQFDDFRVTRQEAKVARGGLVLNNLALGPLLEAVPGVALLKNRPSGTVSGRVDLQHWPLSTPTRASAKARIDQFAVSWQGFEASTERPPSFQLEGGRLTLDSLALKVAPAGGEAATLDVKGELSNLGPNTALDLQVTLRPIALSSFSRLFATNAEMEGVVDGRVRIAGNLEKPTYSGGFQLKNGSLDLRGAPLALSEISIETSFDNAGLNITRATAKAGGGVINASGSLPLRGFRPERFSGRLEASNIALPVAPGVDVSVDATLEGTWEPQNSEDEEAALPKIGGEVSIRSFEYSRPVTMNADISTLTGRPKRTQFESYDPEKDVVELDVLVTSKGALKLNNNLIEATLELEPSGLRLTGTNQRFGLRGNVKVLPGGRIRLRRNEFEVQAGEVQFEDATRIAPRVDVTAVTEYRRFSSTTSTGTSAAPSSASSGASAASTTAGQWRINMHAYGDAENLKLDLTSQPKLSQDDIFLLLTVGLTRAELDQAQSASLGESVALEALGSLTGADSAVSEAIPAIDEFRFGSSYSARTGRTEPTVTVGKRLSERIRAYVTSGISESREVRSNLEWRLKPGVSVEGSYDNVDDVSSSSLGNLGADVRWRLEFE